MKRLLTRKVSSHTYKGVFVEIAKEEVLEDGVITPLEGNDHYTVIDFLLLNETRYLFDSLRHCLRYIATKRRMYLTKEFRKAFLNYHKKRKNDPRNFNDFEPRDMKRK